MQSRTVFVINVDGCPVLWKSHIQSLTSMSTMQSEFIALSACYLDLIPIIAMVDEVGAAIGLI